MGSFKISTTQNICSLRKTMRIMNFASLNSHTTLLFNNCSVLKFIDIINTESFALVNIFFNENSFLIFTESFKLASATHSYSTRSAKNGLLFVPSYTSDFEENKLFTQLHLLGIIFKISLWYISF